MITAMKYCAPVLATTGRPRSSNNSNRPHAQVLLRQKHHQGAICLNDLGCELLSMGAFQDAIDTFNDAVSIMKANFSTDGPLLTASLPALIQKANDRLTSPQLSEVLAMRSYVEASTPPFSLLTLEDYLDFELDEHTLRHQFHSFICPITIGHKKCSCHDIKLDSDLDSAIMLYNLGLAYVCFSKCQQPGKDRESLQGAATRLLELSVAIVQRFHTSDHESVHKKDCHQDESFAKHITLISVAILHAMYQHMAQAYSLDPETSDNLLERLYYLHDMVCIEEHANEMYPSESLPAAAA